MRFIFNKISLFDAGILSFLLIVAGVLLRAILIPIQDIHLLSSEELLETQREYAINYPAGTGLYFLGLFLMISVIMLLMIKLYKEEEHFMKKRSD